MHRFPAHGYARHEFAKKGYPALPDEDLGFFFDPKKVQYRSAIKIATEDPKRHPLGENVEEQTWEALNHIQGFCPACEIQQLRYVRTAGLFRIFDMRLCAEGCF